MFCFSSTHRIIGVYFGYYKVKAIWKTRGIIMILSVASYDYIRHNC